MQIYVLGLELLRLNFLQISQWGAQTFPPIFGLFAIFDRKFAKIVAPPSNRNKNSLELLKQQSLVKKNSENRIKIDP